LKNLIEICDQYSTNRLVEEEEENEEESKIIEFINLMKKIDYLTKCLKNEANKNVLIDSFQLEINLIKMEYLPLIMNLNQHLDKVLMNNREFIKAIDKCGSSSNNIRIPFEQQEYFLQYLDQCEKNLKNLSDNLTLYEKFNLSLHFNGSYLHNFSLQENQFYEFYQNLQNEIDYFFKFYQKFVNESKIIR
jgi:hypothetical protein